MPADLDRLRLMLEPGVRSLGYELVDVEMAGQGRQAVLRLYIDHSQGITVEDCAAVSRQVSAVLDVEDPIPGRYTLEVSSPGLERPLRTREDYSRFQGSLVRIRTAVPIAGRQNFKGRLQGLTGDRVVLETDDGRHEVAFGDIEKARLVPEWPGHGG